MGLLIAGATVIDGIADAPLDGDCVRIEGGRITAIGRRADFAARPDVEVLDAGGKFAIPGLMNANVHLLCDVRLETLVRYMDRYEDLIVEAAQVALKGGLTTVFDTWGPRRSLMRARDRINSGERIGSRIFCAGNIVGFDGPISDDFFARTVEVASAALTRRLNAIWAENVGRHLMWLSPEDVAKEVRTYLAKGIDFVKYASNEHGAAAGAFLQFSLEGQRAIVEEAHRAGTTAQAHTTSIEGLRLAVEAGCDLIQHANITGPTAIPEATLQLLVRRRTGAVVFPFTQRGFAWLRENVSNRTWTMWQTSDANARALVAGGARILLANDGAVLGTGWRSEPMYAKSWCAAPEEESLSSLGFGHFTWLRAMEEKGCKPMDLLKASTSNIAASYGKDKDLGSIGVGKIADLLLLDRNPLESAENYRSIHLVVKEGAVIDTAALPDSPVLTAPMEPPVEEEATYLPFLTTDGRFPMCPVCMCR